MIIAKYEIVVCKVISIRKSPLITSPEYKSSKDDIVEYMNIRDNMIKNVKNSKLKL